LDEEALESPADGDLALEGAVPTPTLAFLFTDVVGSSSRWETEREGMSLQMERHDRLVRSTVVEFGGHVFKTVGDGFCSAFPRAEEALFAAFAVHHRLCNASWNQSDPLHIRSAIHCGAALERDQDYFGPTINRTARLLEIAIPDHVVLSKAAFSLVEDNLPTGLKAAYLGSRRLKGLERPEDIYSIDLSPAVLDRLGPDGPLGASTLSNSRIRIGLLSALAAVALAAVVVVLVLTFASSGSPGHRTNPANYSVWGQDGFDGSHSGFNPYERFLGVGNVPRLHLAWTAQAEAGHVPTQWSAVTLDHGLIYAGSNQGTWAFSASTGKRAWFLPGTGDTSRSAPCVVGNRIYVGSAEGELFALSAGTGRIEMEFQTQPQTAHPAPLTSPVPAAGRILVGSVGGGTFAVAPFPRPTLLWRVGYGTHTTSPTVIGRTVLLGSSDGVQAIAVGTGHGLRAWGNRFNPTGLQFSAPALSDGSAFVNGNGLSGRRNGYLYALDVANGQEIWRFPNSGARSAPLGQPAVARGFVYVASGRGVLSELDAFTGQRDWIFPPNGRSTGQTFFWRPSVANGVVYVGGVGPTGPDIYAIQAGTGLHLWRYQWNQPLSQPARDESSSEPVVAGRYVYVSNSSKGPAPTASKAGIFAFTAP